MAKRAERIQTSRIQTSSASNMKKATRSDASEQSVLEQLKSDHRQIEQQFAEYKKQTDNLKKAELIKQICSEIIIHIALSEEIAYPALKEAGVPEELLDSAHVAHDSARHSVEELMTSPDNDRYRDAKVSQLARIIRGHVASQEEAQEGLFAKAEEAGLDDAEIVARMQERRKSLVAYRDAGVLEPTPPVTSNYDPGDHGAPRRT